MRLLLVEDDLPIQRFLKRALLEAGYQVDTASNAKSSGSGSPGRHSRCPHHRPWPSRHGRIGLDCPLPRPGQFGTGFNRFRPAFCG